MLLPIAEYKQEIIDSVNNNAVTIITSETGSGKSTQVPQYLYEAGYDVVITEPRRMATWSLAERVSEEMNEPLGGIVGYRTAFEGEESSKTSILYCTDGLEVIRELRGIYSKRKRVLIIDEVHEWNLHMEVLIALAKKMLAINTNLRIVIISATIEDDMFTNFFGKMVNILNLPGSLFPIEFEEAPRKALLPNILKMIREGRNVLVFLPGIEEIRSLRRTLLDQDAIILSLYGDLSVKKQQKCFLKYSRPKVILATNVAQTSITIPDIDVVIDTGEEKRKEVRDGIEGLFLNNISKADCIQRMGRAGRTKNGKYILCSDKRFKDRDEFPVPDIQRTILDQLVLQLANYKIDATQIEFIHQPPVEALEDAKQILIDLGAIKDNQVTTIGYRMSQIPLNVQTAKMIVTAEKLKVVEDVIVIASILNIGSLWNRKNNGEKLIQECQNDVLAELEAWKKFEGLEKAERRGLTVFNYNNYVKVKEYVKKMREVLSDSVKISSSGDKEAIKFACISGMINHVYVKEFFNTYTNGNGISKKIDSKSVVKDYPELIVGFPKILENKSRLGVRYEKSIISYVIPISAEDIKYVEPDALREEYDKPYWSKKYKKFYVRKKTFLNDLLIQENLEEYN